MAGLKIPQVCIELNVSPSTLQAWRKKGIGPEWKPDYRGRVWYEAGSVRAWKSRGSDPFAAADPYADVPNSAQFQTDPAQSKPPPFTMPDFLRRQAEEDAAKTALPPTRKAQAPRPQPGEIRPQPGEIRPQPGEIRPPGVPASAEWDGHHIAWVWEEDGETVMAGSDGERI